MNLNNKNQQQKKKKKRKNFLFNKIFLSSHCCTIQIRIVRLIMRPHSSFEKTNASTRNEFNKQCKNRGSTTRTTKANKIKQEIQNNKERDLDKILLLFFFFLNKKFSFFSSSSIIILLLFLLLLLLLLFFFYC